MLQRDEFVYQWNLLDGYLKDAFGDDYESMRDAAGHTYYRAAMNEDWNAAAEMVNTALTFVDDNLATLKTKSDLDDEFVATLKAEGEDVRRVVRRLFKEQDAAEDATGEKLTANEACYAEFTGMCADAQRVFGRQPEIAKKFQVESLLQTVRGTNQAGHSRGSDRRQRSGRTRRHHHRQGKARRHHDHRRGWAVLPAVGFRDLHLGGERDAGSAGGSGGSGGAEAGGCYRK